jgi:hypothetical protein
MGQVLAWGVGVAGFLTAAVMWVRASRRESDARASRCQWGPEAAYMCRVPPEGEKPAQLYVPPVEIDHKTRWRIHAYPLKLATIQVQGTRHATREDLLPQFEKAVARIRAGEPWGEESDDDYGFRFEVMEGNASIFPEGFSLRAAPQVPLDLSAELAAVVGMCGMMFYAVRAATKLNGCRPETNERLIFYIGDVLENLHSLGECLRNGQPRQAAVEARLVAGYLRAAFSEAPMDREEPAYTYSRAAFAALEDPAVRVAGHEAAAVLERIAERLTEIAPVAAAPASTDPRLA